MRHIYADYAATTPVDKRVLKKASPYFIKMYGNPSSAHSIGVEAKKALNESREAIARFFKCSPGEVFFTSSGTESENLAIKGRAFSNKKHGTHIVISTIEHAAVDSSASFLEKQGFKVSRVPVTKDCVIDVQLLKGAIQDDTTLVSVMYVNNEIGSIQPIREISQFLKKINEERKAIGKPSIFFHVDGEAGSIYMDYDVDSLGVDSISINGSKLYGMKGASALYVRGGVGIATQICGGGQESMIRGGTENVAAIVALAEAVTLAENERGRNNKKIAFLKQRLISLLQKEIPGIRINTPSESVANIVHATLPGVVVQDIVTRLDQRGICISNGAACASNKDKKSQVLEALGFTDDEMKMSVRFSLGTRNSVSDIRHIIKVLKDILKK